MGTEIEMRFWEPIFMQFLRWSHKLGLKISSCHLPTPVALRRNSISSIRKPPRTPPPRRLRRFCNNPLQVLGDRLVAGLVGKDTSHGG